MVLVQAFPAMSYHTAMHHVRSARQNWRLGYEVAAKFVVSDFLNDQAMHLEAPEHVRLNTYVLHATGNGTKKVCHSTRVETLLRSWGVSFRKIPVSSPDCVGATCVAK